MMIHLEYGHVCRYEAVFLSQRDRRSYWVLRVLERTVIRAFFVFEVECHTKQNTTHIVCYSLTFTNICRAVFTASGSEDRPLRQNVARKKMLCDETKLGQNVGRNITWTPSWQHVKNATHAKCLMT